MSKQQPRSLCRVLLAGLVVVWSGPLLAQESRMRVCTKEYLANKAAVEARGLTQKDYVAECLLRPAGATAPTAAESAPPAAAPPAPAARPANMSPWVVVVSAGGSASTMSKLAGFAGKDKCTAAAKAIRANLKKAAEVAKIDCVAASTLAAATPAPSPK